MQHSPLRRAVGALTAAVAFAALGGALAPVASAMIAPTLKLTQSTTTAGATGATLGMDVNFAPSSSPQDFAKDVTFVLPPGLLEDMTINNGACLTSATPTSACQVASGTATVAGNGAPLPVTVDLIQAPAAGDVGGLALVDGVFGTSTAEVQLRPASDPAGGGLDLKFANLASTPPVSELNLTFTGVRMPATCPSTPATVTVNADSQSAPSTIATASAPLTVDGCSGLAYAPALSAAAKKDTSDNNVSILTNITQAATEAPSSSVTLVIPSNLTPNLAGAAHVLCATPDATFSNCTPIGTAAAASPLVPTNLTGSVYLTGSIANPMMTIDFNTPFTLELTGTVSASSGTVAFSGIPDVPLTSLALLISGGSNGLFSTTCSPASASASASFTDANGDKQASSSTPLTISGCPTGPTKTPGLPTLSASASGARSGKLALNLKLAAGNNGAASLSTVTVSLPRGLRFIRAGLAMAISVSGAVPQAAALNGGKLTVALAAPAAHFTLKISRTGIAVTTSLESQIKHRKVKSLTVSVSVKDAKGITTRLSKAVAV
jgi:hypothetical protein